MIYHLYLYLFGRVYKNLLSCALHKQWQTTSLGFRIGKVMIWWLKVLSKKIWETKSCGRICLDFFLFIKYGGSLPLVCLMITFTLRSVTQMLIELICCSWTFSKNEATKRVIKECCTLMSCEDRTFTAGGKCCLLSWNTGLNNSSKIVCWKVSVR